MKFIDILPFVVNWGSMFQILNKKKKRNGRKNKDVVFFSDLFFRGVTSVVELAVHEESGTLFAVKIIDKKKYCKDKRTSSQLT